MNRMGREKERAAQRASRRRTRDAMLGQVSQPRCARQKPALALSFSGTCRADDRDLNRTVFTGFSHFLSLIHLLFIASVFIISSGYSFQHAWLSFSSKSRYPIECSGD